MIIHGCYGSLDAKWLQSIKDLLGDRAINSHASKQGTSAVGAVAETAANVALRRPALGAV
jgi:hypothetical protein